MLLLFCGYLGVSIRRDKLKDMWLGDWLRVVMASRAEVKASFRILNSMIPNLLNVAYEKRIFGEIKSSKM